MNGRCQFVVVLCAAAGAAGAQPPLPLQPGVSYFTDEFDAGLIPWRSAPERNVEEVFKNHEYYELVFGNDRQTLFVIRHRSGREPERREYVLRPSGALEPVPDNAAWRN